MCTTMGGNSVLRPSRTKPLGVKEGRAKEEGQGDEEGEEEGERRG